MPPAKLCSRRARPRSTLRSEAGRSASRSTPSSRETATSSGALYAAVAAEAARAPEGPALDAFGGVGLFAGALLDAGHRVVSVEADAGRGIGRRRHRRTLGGRPPLREPRRSPSRSFSRRDERRFTCVVADPPRAGLGTELARELAERTEEVFVYVSCDPATLARDLPAILAEGFAIRTRSALRSLRVHAPRGGAGLARARRVIRPVLAGGRAPAATAAILLVGGTLAGRLLDERRGRVRRARGRVSGVAMAMAMRRRASGARRSGSRSAAFWAGAGFLSGAVRIARPAAVAARTHSELPSSVTSAAVARRHARRFLERAASVGRAPRSRPSAFGTARRGGRFRPK